MASKQQEFYNKLKQDIETNIQTYKDFQSQIDQIKNTAAERIKKLKADMKFIARQIDDNNKQLQAQGQETITFTPDKDN